ncbi:MAG: YraN family protein [Armatimonadota bacterium]|nr:YraN family protein [Armatimonadota bacterium]
MPTARSLLGQRAESLASEQLARMGYRLVCRNYRCRGGEIDIIAWDGACLSFVEVRSHRSASFGLPAESIDLRKQRKLHLTAQTYLSENNLHEANCRFDVVEVVFAKGRLPIIEVIKGAFDAPDE